MRRPPASVAFVARTHWIVAAAVAFAMLPLHWIGQRLPGFEIVPHTYVIVACAGSTYALTGTLVWLGAPLGRTLSRICTLLYLPRPRFGSFVWDTMNRADFQAHFSRK